MERKLLSPLFYISIIIQNYYLQSLSPLLYKAIGICHTEI